jgi:hypothetical protein
MAVIRVTAGCNTGITYAQVGTVGEVSEARAAKAAAAAHVCNDPCWQMFHCCAHAMCQLCLLSLLHMTPAPQLDLD